jgi:hypothetical protein
MVIAKQLGAVGNDTGQLRLDQLRFCQPDNGGVDRVDPDPCGFDIDAVPHAAQAAWGIDDPHRLLELASRVTELAVGLWVERQLV